MRNVDDAAPFTFAEDLKLCVALVHQGGIEARGSAAWFRETLVPPPRELAHRSLDGLLRRYLSLKDELLEALAYTHREGREDVSWEWLEHKHTRAMPQYAEDLALCQLVQAHRKMGVALGLDWFRDVAGPTLGVRDQGVALHARYESVLRSKLARAVLFSPNGQTSFRWLREMHGIAYEPDAATASRTDTLSAISALEGVPWQPWFAQQRQQQQQQQQQQDQQQQHQQQQEQYEAQAATQPSLLEGRQRRIRRAPVQVDGTRPARSGKRERAKGPDVQTLLINLNASAASQVCFDHEMQGVNQANVEEVLEAAGFHGGERFLLAAALLRATCHSRFPDRPALRIQLDHDVLAQASAWATQQHQLDVEQHVDRVIVLVNGARLLDVVRRE